MSNKHRLARIIDLKSSTEPKTGPLSDRDLAVEQPAAKVHAETRFISWSATLHRQPDLKFLMLLSLFLFTIAALIQIFQKNIITTIFFALLGAVLLLNARSKNETGSFELNPAGVLVNGRNHRYPEIKSFWIEYDPALGIKEISLQLKRWYAPYVKIPLAEQNPVQLRLFLLEFLPEEEHKDSMAEIVSRKLGL